MIKALIFDIGGVLEFIYYKGFAKEIAAKHPLNEVTFREVEVENSLKLDLGEIDTD